MWYSPVINCAREEERKIKESSEIVKKLREDLIPLRRQLEYLASYRCSQYKEPNFRTSDFR